VYVERPETHQFTGARAKEGDAAHGADVKAVREVEQNGHHNLQRDTTKEQPMSDGM
jgi:hypothetical protein